MKELEDLFHGKLIDIIKDGNLEYELTESIPLHTGNFFIFKNIDTNELNIIEERVKNK